MILSEKHARLYATYRQRLIDGPQGYYCDATLRSCSVPNACNEFPGVEFQREGAPVPFLRQATTDVTEPGAFLVADLLRVADEPEGAAEEERYITGIRHADQTLYASNLLLGLVAEYVITYDDQTLEFAESVLAMLRRLGTWQPGYQEEAAIVAMLVQARRMATWSGTTRLTDSRNRSVSGRRTLFPMMFVYMSHLTISLAA